jgi:hypothetical protein
VFLLHARTREVWEHQVRWKSCVHATQGDYYIEYRTDSFSVRAKGRDQTVSYFSSLSRTVKEDQIFRMIKFSAPLCCWWHYTCSDCSLRILKNIYVPRTDLHTSIEIYILFLTSSGWLAHKRAFQLKLVTPPLQLTTSISVKRTHALLPPPNLYTSVCV